MARSPPLAATYIIQALLRHDTERGSAATAWFVTSIRSMPREQEIAIEGELLAISAGSGSARKITRSAGCRGRSAPSCGPASNDWTWNTMVVERSGVVRGAEIENFERRDDALGALANAKAASRGFCTSGQPQ